jgi:hypothetical protein
VCCSCGPNQWSCIAEGPVHSGFQTLAGWIPMPSVGDRYRCFNPAYMASRSGVCTGSNSCCGQVIALIIHMASPHNSPVYHGLFSWFSQAQGLPVFNALLDTVFCSAILLPTCPLLAIPMSKSAVSNVMALHKAKP